MTQPFLAATLRGQGDDANIHLWTSFDYKYKECGVETVAVNISKLFYPVYWPANESSKWNCENSPCTCWWFFICHLRSNTRDRCLQFTVQVFLVGFFGFGEGSGTRV
jgi:hypothetical protein